MNVRPHVRDFKAALEALEKLLSVTPGRGKDLPGQPSLASMHEYVKRAGLPISSLRAIHVAGTKGKGSTCALTESVLRQMGMRTGLYSSPHLVDVRERIRINGEPVGKESFAVSFWKLWDRLEASQPCAEHPFPTYFRFLTLLGIQMFLEARVDVAIVEVGIGGRLDATNVLPPAAVAVCGVTSLGFDHMALLGDTLGAIASEKAGIFKPGVRAITAPQRQEAMDSLRRQAAAVSVPLYVAPSSDAWAQQLQGVSQFRLGLAGEFQKENAGLALSLVDSFLERCALPDAVRVMSHRDLVAEFRAGNTAAGTPPPYPVSSRRLGGDVAADVAAGLANTRWPGRAQLVQRSNAAFFLDGAHTEESLQVCLKWFRADSPQLAAGAAVRRVLVFWCSGDRSPSRLFRALVDAAAWPGGKLDRVVISVLDSSRDSLVSGASAVAQSEALARAQEIVGVWNAMTADARQSLPLAEASCSVDDAIRAACSAGSEAAREPVHVLVTGSLYLVGDFLKHLGEAPEYSS